MKLHRTNKKPDWELVALSGRTSLQRLAARTNGWVTLPNIISLVGFGLVLGGIAAFFASKPMLGVVLIFVGRLGDLADGMVAEATGTKSPLGEIIDATLDKAAILLVAIGFLLLGNVPWFVLVALLAANIMNSFCAFFIWYKKYEVHPSALGKLAAALSWVGVVAVGVGMLAEPLKVFAWGLLLFGSILTVMAAVGYMREARELTKS